MPSDLRVGIVFDRAQPPERLVPFAQAVERWGADDLWLVEDLTWGGAVASAGTALSATERLRLGIGLFPAPLRNPALLAMELATLARLHPGRLAAGVGHGVKEWMEQVGAWPVSSIALLDETVRALRALLAGEKLTLHGREVTIDDLQLVHPPTVVPPILVGAIGPRTLALSGRAAQGTILVEGLDPARVAAARAKVDEGRALASEESPTHEVVALVYARVGAQEEVDRVTRPVAETLADLFDLDPSEVFMAAGPAEKVAEDLQALHEAGVDTVALHLIGDDDQLDQAHQVLAALNRS